MPRDITVRLSSGEVVKYAGVPDDVTPEQVQSRIGQEYPDTSILEIDGGRGETSTPKQESTSSPTFLSETGRVLDTGIRGGLSAVPALMDLYTKAPEMVAKGFGMDLPPQTVEQQLDSVVGPETATPNTSFMKAYQNATGGNIRRPETQTGRFVGEGLQGIIGALTGPGGLYQPVRNAAIGAASGLTGEAADFMIDKDNDNPIYRLIGAILGGGTTAGLSAFRPNRDTIIRTATQNVPDTQFQKADELMTAFDEKGIPTLSSQFLGPTSTLDDVVNEMSTHQAIRPKLMEHLQELPGKANSLLRSLLEKHFPIATGSRPDTFRDIKELATDATKAKWDTAGEAYRKQLHPQADNYQYYADEIDELRKSLLDAADNPSFAGKNTPAGNEIKDYVEKFIPELEIGTSRSAGELNSLVKTLNQDAPRFGYGETSTNLIADVLKQFTDDIYGNSRRAMKKQIDEVILPYERSVIGDLKRIGGELKPDRNTLTDNAFGMLFSPNTDMTKQIKFVGDELGPDSVGSLLREYLQKSINASEKLYTGDAQKFQQPTKALEQIVGTPTQRANVEEGLKVLTKGTNLDPDAISKEFFKTVEMLDTLKDLKIASGISPVSVQQTAGQDWKAFAIATASRMGRSLWEKKTKEVYEQIFDMITTRDGLKKIQEIAKSPDPKATQVFLRSLLTSSSDDMSREE